MRGSGLVPEGYGQQKSNEMIALFGVARYDPLKIYVNFEGLVRFATELYSESVETLQSRTQDLYIYLL